MFLFDIVDVVIGIIFIVELRGRTKAARRAFILIILVRAFPAPS